LITRVRKVRARDLARIKLGIFAGEPVAPYRRALDEAWGLTHSYNLYTFSEWQIGCAECSAHAGLHIWTDVSLPEIILKADLAREHEEPGHTPTARPLWQAQAGDEGELVVTHLGEAFPLVRWRTADLVRVVSVEPCACGRTAPRVEILQRSDDLVNLGIIRFSIFTLKEKVDAITRPAAVARWQLRVSRRGYRPLLTILVRPAGPAEETQMIQAVHDAVAQIENVRQGWENGLVCEPVVCIAPDLGDRQSSSGKFRPLVYETDAPSEEAAR
jgi:phenylacetate-coenzyme A ligase PaaK-like adenylate-forming protein